MVATQAVGPLRTVDDLVHAVEQMGGLCEVQLGNAVDAAARRDSALAQQVIEADTRIDDLENAVEQGVVTVLTEHHPQDADLRLSLSVMKIAAELERIGDMAKNIAKRALVLNREEPLDQLQVIARMGREALLQLKNVLDAFSERDAERAMAVWRSDEDIDKLYTVLFKHLLSQMRDSPRTIGLCTHLLFVAKNIERVGDHATNIAEAIHYFVQGSYVRSERPKGDTTSLTSISFDG